MTKKIISLVLVLLMLIPFVVSCKKGDETGNESSDAVSTDQGEETTDKYDVADDVGTRDYEGRTITFAQSGNEYYRNEVCVERLTGDLVDDAIYKRTQTVEERLNVKVSNVLLSNSLYAVVNDLEKNVIAGTVAYDVVHAPVYTSATGITKGLLRDLNDAEDIDLDKEYWSGYVNEALEIGGMQYIASGAIALSFYKFTWVTLVNDDMLNSHEGAPDLIQAVKDGKWTIEYQRTITTNYYDDKGAYGKDDDDIVGLITTTGINVDPYLSSGGVSVLKKGDGGFYTYDFDLQRASDVLGAVNDLYLDRATYCSKNDSSQDYVAKKFGSGEALMATLRLADVESNHIRDMKEKYTILPVPRLNENQDGYYSFVHDSFTGIAIPSTVGDDEIEAVGATLEVMASESYSQVVPNYYEIVLKTRLVDSVQAVEFLDMIMQNVKMDAIVPYTQTLVPGSEEENARTVIKLWRYTIAKSYYNGVAPEVASTFTYDLGTKVTEKLDGEGGLQTYIREQLNKQ